MDHKPNILKCDGSNYSSWSYWMCNSALEKHLLELVNGSVPKPGPKDQNFTLLLNNWEAKNAQVLSLINDHVDPSIRKSLAVFKSAKEAWNYLARLYAHSTLAESFHLEKEVRAVSQGDRTIQELHGVLVSFWDKLAVVEPKDLSGSDSFKKHREEQRLVQLLLALRDDFEPLRSSILQRPTFPSVQEAVEELIVEERRLKSLLVSSKHEKSVSPLQSQLESLTLSPQFDHQVSRNQSIYCHQTGHSMIDHADKLKNVSETGRYVPPSKRYGGSQSSNTIPMQRTSRPAASHLTPDNKVGSVLSVIKMIAQVHSDYFGESPLESGCYLPDCDEEEDNSSKHSSTLKILTYNVWFREDIEVHKRMESIGSLIQLHSPDIICFQEVTPYIYDIFKQSNWWGTYTCSISDEMACTRKYFCMQLSKPEVKSFIRKPFRNSRMGRELCVAWIEVEGVDDPLIVATSHLESPQPTPPKFDQLHSEERVAQAKEVLRFLRDFPNVIFCGDLNWDDDLDGKFPLFGDWIDAWEELRPGENGWTYDTKSNPMLLGNRPLQKRLDRFVCSLSDFELDMMEMIGMEAIPGVKYYKEMRKGMMVRELPVLPSDHYGLLLQVSI